VQFAGDLWVVVQIETGAVPARFCQVYDLKNNFAQRWLA
jgi:hypothetical protein